RAQVPWSGQGHERVVIHTGAGGEHIALLEHGDGHYMLARAEVVSREHDSRVLRRRAVQIHGYGHAAINGDSGHAAIRAYGRDPGEAADGRDKRQRLCQACRSWLGRAAERRELHTAVECPSEIGAAPRPGESGRGGVIYCPDCEPRALHPWAASRAVARAHLELIAWQSFAAGQLEIEHRRGRGGLRESHGRKWAASGTLLQLIVLYYIRG